MSGPRHTRKNRLDFSETVMSLTEVAQEIGITPQAVR